MMKPSEFGNEMLRGLNGFLSSKRVMTNRVVWAFIVAMLTMTGCIGYRIAKFGEVGWGAVAAFTALTAPLGTIAIGIYRKKEGETNATP